MPGATQACSQHFLPAKPLMQSMAGDVAEGSSGGKPSRKTSGCGGEGRTGMRK